MLPPPNELKSRVLGHTDVSKGQNTSNENRSVAIDRLVRFFDPSVRQRHEEVTADDNAFEYRKQLLIGQPHRIRLKMTQESNQCPWIEEEVDELLLNNFKTPNHKNKTNPLMAYGVTGSHPPQRVRFHKIALIAGIANRILAKFTCLINCPSQWLDDGKFHWSRTL